MEIKLKSGRKFKLKETISLDERDSLLDGVQWDIDKDGNITTIKAMNSTMTKWLRTCLEKGDDKFIMGLSLDNKSEIFTKLQTVFFQGGGKASK